MVNFLISNHQLKKIDMSIPPRVDFGRGGYMILPKSHYELSNPEPDSKEVVLGIFIAGIGLSVLSVIIQILGV